MDIDYSKFGIEELESALNSIDREKYPDNYRRAQEAWERLHAQSEASGDREPVPADSAPIYKNFWRRVGATFLDGLIMLPFGLVPFFLVRTDFTMGLVSYLALIPFGLFYQVWFPVRYGATPGKMAFGLKIMTVELEPIGWDQALRRNAPQFALSIVSCMLGVQTLLANREAIPAMDLTAFGLLMGSGSMKSVSTLSHIWMYSEWLTMLFNPKRRAIHDFIGGTVVVRWIRPGPSGI